MVILTMLKRATMDGTGNSGIDNRQRFARMMDINLTATNGVQFRPATGAEADSRQAGRAPVAGDGNRPAAADGARPGVSSEVRTKTGEYMDRREFLTAIGVPPPLRGCLNLLAEPPGAMTTCCSVG
jgi:hypothetical protein